MLKVENLVRAGSFALSALGGAAERARYTVAASSRVEGSWWFPSHPAGWLSEEPGVRVRRKKTGTDGETGRTELVQHDSRIFPSTAEIRAFSEVYRLSSDSESTQGCVDLPKSSGDFPGGDKLLRPGRRQKV
ncbi:unnamed protein product [Rangifer tarandus platyrhynchus]|uniref:Uncharacterized protein n=1 Tax=Rangifer tarandus platyrhynchus TaxID=3082113 RepID=A0ABN8Y008_RANTA|nr:unnamed protein product [Rangifer tarandus platyrhynchus]